MTSRSRLVISEGMIAISFLLMIAVQGYSAPLNTAPPASSDVYHMELPGRDWALEVRLPGFVIQQEEVQAHAQGAKMIGEKPDNGTYVSMFMEPRPTPATSKSCRDDYWAKGKDSPLKKTNIELSDLGQMSVIKWFQPDHEGARIDQQHMHVFLGRDNVCTEVHMSKVYFKPGEESVFGEVFRTIQYKEIASPTSKPHMTEKPADHMAYRFTVSKQNRLRLSLPATWRAGMRQDPNGMTSTIKIWPTGSERFEVLISRIPRKNGEGPVTSERLLQIVRENGQMAASHSAEQKLDVKAFGPGNWKGYYYRLTDKAPRPNEYKYMTQGAMSEGTILFTFTFLTNSDKAFDQEQVLRLLSSAQLEL
jgi:hypothetical protein